MKSDLCPVCVEPDSNGNNFHSNNDYQILQNIIFKHLQIQIHEEYLPQICKTCEFTILDWNKYAEKCWSNQRQFEEILQTPRVKTENVELSDVEIKVENTNTFSDNDDFHNVSEDDSQGPDPLFSLKSFKEKSPHKERKKHSKKVKKRSPKKYSPKIDETVCKGENESLDDMKIEVLLSDVKIENVDNDKNYNSVDRNDRIKNNPPINITPRKISRKKKSSIIEYVCHICAIREDGWIALSRHCMEEHSTKPIVLCICGKYLKSFSTVKVHQNLHDDDRAYKCNQCGKKFGCGHTFREHMLTHLPVDEYKFSCPHCPKKFNIPELFKKHVKTHLPRELKNIYPCDICGEKLTSTQGVKVHKMSVHEKLREHICDVCGQKYSTKGNLECHKSTMHNDVRSFECDQCPKKFKTKQLFNRHVEFVHTDSKIKCPLCPSILKNKKTFQMHKSVHEDVYKHPCTICEKKFKRSYHLKAHMNVHVQPMC